MSLLGQNVVILNDQRLAEELLNERGESTCGRYHSFVAMDLFVCLESLKRNLSDSAHNRAGWGRFLANQQPGKRHTESRRILHQIIGTKQAAARFAFIQEQERGRFLKKLLEKPENFHEHSRW